MAELSDFCECNSSVARVAETRLATVFGEFLLLAYRSPIEPSGPYLSRQWCIDRYADAAHRFRGCAPGELPWTEKIEEPGVMDLIEVEEVNAKLDEFLESRI